MKPTLWVFGFGQFMQFFTPYLQKYFDIYVYDSNGSKSQDIKHLWVNAWDISQVAGCEYVLLWYPANSIRDLLWEIQSLIQPWAVVFDICSIKTPPVTNMEELLPKSCHIIATHPIFGPQSGKDGIEWCTMTITNIRCEANIFHNFLRIFSEKLKLKIIDISPEDHDKQMAYIQGITHFIGRALKDISMPNSQLATQSYLHLLEAKEMVGNDSDALFLSIQSDNPFVESVRTELLDHFQELDTWIQQSNNRV